MVFIIGFVVVCILFFCFFFLLLKLFFLLFSCIFVNLDDLHALYEFHSNQIAAISIMKRMARILLLHIHILSILL